MNAERRWAFLLYGVATFLSFPHELPGSASGPLDLGIVFAGLGPAALLVGLSEASPRQAARWAFWASLLAHSVFFHWFMVVTITYGGMPFFLGVLAPVVPALYVSIFTALFAWAAATLGLTTGAREGVRAVAWGAALWVAVDCLRGHFLGGFPWATLGYALHLDVPLMAWTQFVGVYGLSFVAAGIGVALAQAWRNRSQGVDRTLVWVALSVVLLHGGGALLNVASSGDERSAGTANSDKPVETIRVAAIQGSIDQSEKWDADRRARILDTYLRLSEQAGAEGAEWIVWPETAVPGLVENDAILREQLADLARRHQAFLVVGGMGVEIDHAARRFSAFFDSAFLFDPAGRLQDRYDKTHLVPFGEYVPLRALLGQFFQSLATGLSSNDVTPGVRPRNMVFAEPGNSGPGRLVGVPICYELLFPHLVRQFGEQGAGALLAITNDAWYGRTGAPHQFLAMTAMRAAENRRPVIRAANTGISAIIDIRGRVEKRSPLFEEAIVVGEIQFVRGAKPTFYARFGDVFAWGCVGATLVGVLLSFRNARQAKHNDAPSAG